MDEEYEVMNPLEEAPKGPKRQKSLLLDVSEIQTEDELHQALRQALELPQDLKTDWKTLLVFMSTYIVMPKRLEVKGWHALRENCPSGAKRFLRLMKDYERAPGTAPCQLRNLESPAPALFWAPDILLSAAIPVEIMGILVVFGQVGWKIALAALIIAIAVALESMVITGILATMQDRWWLSRTHKRWVVIRTVFTVALFGVAAGGFIRTVSLKGAGLAEGLALAAVVLILAAALGQFLIFVWKTR